MLPRTLVMRLYVVGPVQYLEGSHALLDSSNLLCTPGRIPNSEDNEIWSDSKARAAIETTYGVQSGKEKAFVPSLNP